MSHRPIARRPSHFDDPEEEFVDDEAQAGVWGMRILGFIVALGVAFPAVMFAIYLIVSSLKT
jgi:hypothetical protein